MEALVSRKGVDREVISEESSPLDFQVLGFGFVPTYRKGEKGKYQLVVKPSKWKEFKAKLKQLTKNTIPASFGERIARIKLLVRGWINYFRPASIHAKLKKLEEWLRNRLRYCIWHHWKNWSEAKITNTNKK